jgi:hypothetical protein
MLNGNSELRRGIVAFESRLNFLVPDLTERTDRQANRATIVLGEIIAATRMIDALKTTITPRLWLIVNRSDWTFANALVAHRAKISNPQMRVRFTSRLERRQVGDLLK